MPVADGVPMLDKNNIINQRDGESLYQTCLKLRRRLSGVPGFRQYIDEMEEQEAEGADPVSSLWRCFRAGKPLLTISNAAQPEDQKFDVEMRRAGANNAGKADTFQFLKFCMQQLQIPTSETFLITDLFGDNTTGFQKVLKLVNSVLDILDSQGKLERTPEGSEKQSMESLDGVRPAQMTRRDYILKELVETERQYVHHLLNLQALRRELEETGVLTGDSIHDIFLNLNNILDFAQRFLIRLEQQYSTKEEDQDWGELFVHYENQFRQYEPFIANQVKCELTCTKDWDKMKMAASSQHMQQMLATPATLNSFLIKPFQRLTKYPLMLKDLMKQAEDDTLKLHLQQGIDVIEGVLNQANASLDRDTREAAREDVAMRVEDWRKLKIDQFGELLRFGTFSVQKSDSGKDNEREYHIYLFEAILLCCKDANPNKKKYGKDKPPPLPKGSKPRLQLKGRIFIKNVTNDIVISKPGLHTLQIFWKGDDSTENFTIKFKNEDMLRTWKDELDRLRDTVQTRLSRQNTTSDSQFTLLAGAQMQNPYAEADLDEEEEALLNDQSGFSEFSMSRNASSTSLRSRSTTSGSGGTIMPNPSMRPPRFPMPEPGSLPPLNTRMLPGAPSPMERDGPSYFSPTSERDMHTPLTASTRSSSQSAFSSYNRYGTPVSAWSHPEESNRNTAPAMSRSIKDGGNPYLQNGRSTRPSLPPSVQSAQQLGMGINRMRSASSPDIHNNLPQNQRYHNRPTAPPNESVPNVPPIPAHVAGRVAPVNRSQNNSPTGLPIRTATQSPGAPPAYGLPPRPNIGASHRTYDHSYGASGDPRSATPNGFPPLLAASDRTSAGQTSTTNGDTEPYMPYQLKAKVCFDNNYITLVIASNIQFRSLTDRIDAKLSRFTQHSIGSGSVRLRYQDEDGDYVLIDSDEAVHDAFLDWRETHADKIAAGQTGEILLFCHSASGEPIQPQ